MTASANLIKRQIVQNLISAFKSEYFAKPVVCRIQA